MTDIPHKHNQDIARILKEEHLVEMTPNEIKNRRKEIYATMRKDLKKKGFDLPDDDLEMLFFLREILGDLSKE